MSSTTVEPPRPFPQSQCHQCQHRRDVKTERSWFLMCQSPSVPVKYPPQPVRACPAFEALTP